MRIVFYLTPVELRELRRVVPCREAHELPPDNRGVDVEAQERALQKLTKALEVKP